MDPTSQYPVEWEFVTPALAREYLDHNFDNRNLRPLVVARYAHDLSRDQFAITHHAIAFNADGILEDGQHRLHAIVKANVGMWLLVVRNLPPGTQEFMDRGARRKASDFIEGPSKALQVSSMRALLAIRALGFSVTPGALNVMLDTITDADVTLAFKTEEALALDLQDLTGPARTASRNCVLSPTALVVACLLFPDVADASLAKLVTGAGMEPGDPLLALRNYKVDKHKRSTAKRGESIHAALRIFEHTSKGESLRKFALHGVTRPINIKEF